MNSPMRRSCSPFYGRKPLAELVQKQRNRTDLLVETFSSSPSPIPLEQLQRSSQALLSRMKLEVLDEIRSILVETSLRSEGGGRAEARMERKAVGGRVE